LTIARGVDELESAEKGRQIGPSRWSLLLFSTPLVLNIMLDWWITMISN
jgi:hypothetical protein